MPYRERRPNLVEEVFNNFTETTDTLKTIAHDVWAYMLISLIGQEQYTEMRRKAHIKERQQSHPHKPTDE